MSVEKRVENMIKYNIVANPYVDFGKNPDFDNLLKSQRGRSRTNSGVEESQNTIETQRIIAINNKYDKDYLLIAVDDQCREEDIVMTKENKSEV